MDASDTGGAAPAERCSGDDDDGDGAVDEGFPTMTFFLDEDGDGFGGETECTTCDVSLCGTGDWAEDRGDCDESCASCFPGGLEVCDANDNDCDTTTDEGVMTPYFRDQDSDGFGVASERVEACTLPDGFAIKNGDCADTEPLAHPDQRLFQVMPMTSPPPAGAYDYDCNGTIEPEVGPSSLRCGPSCTSLTFLDDPDDAGDCGAAITTVTCLQLAGICAAGPPRSDILRCR